MARINPKIDLVFKKLFGSEENKDILMSLINAVLPETQQITEVQLKNPYNVSDYAEGKLSILDIKAEDGNGNLYDIEMQLKGTTFYGKRTLYYWAKIFGSQLDYLTETDIQKKEQRGRSYTDLNKCIVISLMDFVFFKDDRYNRCFMLKDRETDETHTDLDYLDLYFVELEKFESRYKAVGSVLDRWIKFLNHADLYSRSTLPRELAEIEPIRKATERLEVMYLDEKERQYYEAQQKRYLDETSRIREEVEKGIKEGIEQAVQQAVQEAVQQAVQEAVHEAVQRAAQEAEQKKHEAVQQAVEQAVQEAEQKRQDAVQRAVQEAERNKQEAVARKAIEKGFDNETIAALTNLPAAHIQRLREAAG